VPFADLDVRFPVRQERMRELGFQDFSVPFVAELAKPGDARRIPPGAGLAVACSPDVELLREAARSSRARLLFSPAFQPDVGLIREAAEKGKAFELPVSPLLQSAGVHRAMLMGKMRFFARLCLKLGAPIVMVSQARDGFGLKSPREMVAVGQSLGLSRDQAEWSMTEAAGLVLDASR